MILSAEVDIVEDTSSQFWEILVAAGGSVEWPCLVQFGSIHESANISGREAKVHRIVRAREIPKQALQVVAAEMRLYDALYI